MLIERGEGNVVQAETPTVIDKCAGVQEFSKLTRALHERARPNRGDRSVNRTPTRRLQQRGAAARFDPLQALLRSFVRYSPAMVPCTWARCWRSNSSAAASSPAISASISESANAITPM